MLQKSVQQQAGGGDGAEHADQNADEEREREPFDETGGEEIQDDRGDDGGGVRIPNGRPGAAKAFRERGAAAEALSAFVIHPFENEDVGVHGHADGQDESREAGQGQGDGDELENRERERDVHHERDGGENAQTAVVDDHEQDHEQCARDAGHYSLLHRVRAQARAYGQLVDEPDGSRQGARVEALDHLLRFIQGNPGYDRLAAGYLLLYHRDADDLVVQEYRQSLADVLFGQLFENTAALLVEGELHLGFLDRLGESQPRAGYIAPRKFGIGENGGGSAGLFHLPESQKGRLADLADGLIHVPNARKLHDELGTVAGARQIDLRLPHAEEVDPGLDDVPKAVQYRLPVAGRYFGKIHFIHQMRAADEIEAQAPGTPVADRTPGINKKSGEHGQADDQSEQKSGVTPHWPEF